MNETGQKFKLIRKKLNFTQYKFAALLGISQGYLSDVENEKNPVGYFAVIIWACFPWVYLNQFCRLHRGSIKNYPYEY